MTRKPLEEWIAEAVELVFLIGFTIFLLSMVWKPLAELGLFIQIIVPGLILGIGAILVIVFKRVDRPPDAARGAAKPKLGKLALLAAMIVLTNGIGTVFLARSTLNWKLSAIVLLQTMALAATLALVMALRRSNRVTASG